MTSVRAVERYKKRVPKLGVHLFTPSMSSYDVSKLKLVRSLGPIMQRQHKLYTVESAKMKSVMNEKSLSKLPNEIWLHIFELLLVSISKESISPCILSFEKKFIANVLKYRLTCHSFNSFILMLMRTKHDELLRETLLHDPLEDSIIIKCGIIHDYQVSYTCVFYDRKTKLVGWATIAHGSDWETEYTNELEHLNDVAPWKQFLEQLSSESRLDSCCKTHFSEWIENKGFEKPLPVIEHDW